MHTHGPLNAYLCSSKRQLRTGVYLFYFLFHCIISDKHQTSQLIKLFCLNYSEGPSKAFLQGLSWLGGYQLQDSQS